MKLAWGKKLKPAEIRKVIEVSEYLGCEPSHLMACMAFESGRTFSPSIRNAAGSGAVGLIQFMPQTALILGTSTDELAAMDFIEQMDYVLEYFVNRRNKLKTLADIYMAILWPVAVGKPSDYVLFRADDPKYPKRYMQNRGLDFNKDGVVTKAECAAKVEAMLAMGLTDQYAYTITNDDLMLGDGTI